jgi:hypothetical protein
VIPYRFHFVFGLKPQTEPFHLMYYLCLASCLEGNRPDSVHFHYQHEPYGPWWERIRPRLELHRIGSDAFVREFRYDDPAIAPFRYAHLSDFSRLEILLRDGGIYADIDSLFLRPLPRALLAHDCVLGREKPPAGADGSLCNAWIAAAPGARFVKLWLEGMRGAFDGSWSGHSTLLPYELSREHADLLHIEPETSFYALDWTPDAIDALFCRRVELPANAYSLHLWNHLWASASRRDFSRFHMGRLTPSYVAFAETTYAHWARPHLPPDSGASAARYAAECAADAVADPLRRVAEAIRHRAANVRSAG